MRNTFVYPGSKVITTSGKVVTVAFVRDGEVWVFSERGVPVQATVCNDAWGGEADQSIGVAA